jgi:hypothetical protein
MAKKDRSFGPSVKFLICAFHALWLMIFTWYWLNLPVTYPDEEHLIRWSAAVKKILLNINDKPPKQDYIFISLTHEKELIPYSEGIGEEVITNRARLARLFQILNKYPGQFKFVICDVFFQGESPSDSLLSAEVRKIDNILSPCHVEDAVLTRPSIPVPNALADYQDVNGMFLKYKFVEDSVKTLPVAMFEKLHQAKVEQKHGLTFVNDQLSLSSMIIDFSIREADLDTSYYPVVPLSELLILNDDSLIFNDYLKDKYIIAGNFGEDIHQTILGQMPGTVILLNVYLALVKGESLVSWYWVIFIFLNYLFISWLMFYSAEINRPAWFEKFLQSDMGGFFVNYLSFFAYLVVLSIASYYIFNIHINILIIGLYINISIYLIRKLRQAPFLFKRNKKILAGNQIELFK